MTTDTAFVFSAGPDDQRLRAALRHFFRNRLQLIRAAGLFGIVAGALTAFVRARVAEA
jgi:hypothetical protein